jgi:hypothetical protein
MSGPAATLIDYARPVSTATATLPRGLVIARAWAGPGDAVAPPGNTTGRPLAGTVRPILDPLVPRPVRKPEFTAGAVEHAGAAELERPRVARTPGLTDQDRPPRPVPGTRASRTTLPKPFDRSVVECPRTHAFPRAGLADVHSSAGQMTGRPAGSWRLADEASRAVLGGEESASLPGNTHARFRSREPEAGP